MNDFFGSKVLPGVLIILILVVCFLIGILSNLALEGGWQSVLGVGLLLACIMGTIAFFMTRYLVDDSERQNLLAAGMTALVVIATLAPTANLLMNGGRDAAYMRKMAPLAQTFVLQHFDQLDADHDGQITDGELGTAAANFSGDDSTLLAFTRDHQSGMGHVIGSYTTTTLIWISTGKSGFFSPVTTTHYIYAINRGDLSDYPQRVIAEYRNW